MILQLTFNPTDVNAQTDGEPSACPLPSGEHFRR